jgi:hypothetical protein
MSTKQNDAASDLWAQIFARMAGDGDATLVSSDYDAAEDETRLRTGLKEAGWSD